MPFTTMSEWKKTATKRDALLRRAANSLARLVSEVDDQEAYELVKEINRELG